MTVSEQLSSTIEDILCSPRDVLVSIYQANFPEVPPADIRGLQVINLKHDLIVHFIEQEVVK